jgi:hypothetical protein
MASIFATATPSSVISMRRISFLIGCFPTGNGSRFPRSSAMPARRCLESTGRRRPSIGRCLEAIGRRRREAGRCRPATDRCRRRAGRRRRGSGRCRREVGRCRRVGFGCRPEAGRFRRVAGRYRPVVGRCRPVDFERRRPDIREEFLDAGRGGIVESLCTDDRSLRPLSPRGARRSLKAASRRAVDDTVDRRGVRAVPRGGRGLPRSGGLPLASLARLRAPRDSTTHG